MSSEKYEISVGMPSDELIERCRKIIRDAKSEIKLPDIDFGLYGVNSWDLLPSITFLNSSSRFDVKRRAREICKKAYENRKNAVKEKSEFLAERLYGALENNSFVNWVRDIADGALVKCRALLDAAYIPNDAAPIDIPFPMISVELSELVQTLREDVVDDKLFSFDTYFPGYCVIHEFDYGIENPFIFWLQTGTWINKTDYSCDCLDCIAEMAKDLNRALSTNFKRVWVKYFSNVVDKTDDLEALLLLAEVYDRRASGTDDVPGTLAEYCAAVCDELDMRFEEMFDSVNRASCTVV